MDEEHESRETDRLLSEVITSDGGDHDGGTGASASSVQASDDNDPSASVRSHHNIDAIIHSIDHSLSMLKLRVGSRQRRPPSKKRWLSRRFTHKLLLLSVFWQALNLLILSVLDSTIPSTKIITHPLDVPEFMAGIVVMIIFEVLFLGVIIVVSIKLTKQILHHTVTNSFLAQSYISTILLYAGIYTLIHRIVPTSLRGVADLTHVHSATYTLQIFVQLFYFSTATMTSTGYGDVAPTVWYMQIIVTTQMLMSVIYSVFIFARGVSVLAGEIAQRANANPDEEDDEQHYRTLTA